MAASTARVDRDGRVDRDARVDADVVVRLRVTLSRLARQLNTSAVSAGFTPTQVSVLTSIVKYGPVGLSALAKLESINATMLSRILGRLEAARLVVREPDPRDSRCVTVRATAAGQAAHRRVRDERSKMLAEHLNRISPEHAAVIVAALPALEALATGMREPRP